MKQSELYFCYFCASLITSFLLLTFSTCHAGIVSSLFHYSSTAAFASRIFITCGIRMNLCTSYDETEFYPLPAFWSSWFFFFTDSILGLLDSCASTIQSNFIFWNFSDALALFRFTAPVTLELSDLPHGIGSGMGISHFFFAFLMICLYSSSFGSME